MGLCAGRPQQAVDTPKASVPEAAPEAARTGVVSVVDEAGEGDGCDRCGLPDEEECCPAFWQDEGVPPIWPLSWVFDRKNPYLNDNACVEKIGHCGFREADKERKVLMGTALGFTVVSILLTTFGCLALSPNPRLVTLTAWAIGFLPSGVEGTIAYVGLSRLVVVQCGRAPPGQVWSDWEACEPQAHWWSDVYELCEAADAAGNAMDLATFGYPCDALVRCAEQATANQVGAFITCFTLLFALIGCLTRIRKRADSNFQKIIGTFPDMVGIITLGTALVTFSARCTLSMVEEEDTGAGYAPGPGFVAYCGCWVAAVVRFSMHAIMPVPNAGVSGTEILSSAGQTVNYQAQSLVSAKTQSMQ